MSQSIEEHTGARIARIRKQRGLTQQGLAMRAHVSKSLLSKVECGQKPASPALVAACARALGVSTSELLGQPYAEELRRDRMDALIQPIREGLENWDIALDWETVPRPAALIRADVQHALVQRRQAQYTDMVHDLPALIEESVHAVHTSTGEEQRLAYECLAGTFRCVFTVAWNFGYIDLATVALDRLAWTAPRADDPGLAAMHACLRAQTTMSSGRYDVGIRVIDRALHDLAGQDARRPAGVEAVRGVMQLRAAVIAGRMKDREQGGFSEVLIVKTAQAAADPRLATLTLATNTHGLNLAADAGGNLTVSDPATGAAVFHAPAPLMWDSSGAANARPQSINSTALSGSSPRAAVVHAAVATARDEAQADNDGSAPGDLSSGPSPTSQQAPVHTDVSSDGHLQLTPDPGLLKSANFPLYIDPTWVTVKDQDKGFTYVQHAYPGTSHWNDSDAKLGVGYQGYTSPTGAERTYYQFSIGSTMGDKNIHYAELDVDETYSADWGCTKYPVTETNVDHISSSTTWNNQPDAFSQTDTYDFTGANNKDCPGGDSGGFSVTGSVSHDGDGTVTYRLTGSESNQTAFRRFSTKATLSITYNTPPRTPTSTTSSPKPVSPATYGCGSAPYGWIPNTDASGGVKLYAHVSDPDGDKQNIRGQFAFWDKGGSGSAAAVNLISTGDSDGNSSTVPGSGGTVQINVDPKDHPLKDGHLYGWHVLTDDGIDTSDEADNCYFWYDATAPTHLSITSKDDLSHLHTGDTVHFSLSAGDPTPTGAAASGLDHFIWSATSSAALDNDGGTSIPAATDGTASLTYTATAWGSTTLWAAAIDKAGNQSQPVRFSFYVPDDVNATVEPGDIDNDHIPDLVAADSGTGNLDLVPTNTDIPTSNGQPAPVFASGPDDAPSAADGTTTWADTLLAHRSSNDHSASGNRVDDLWAYKNSHLWLYTNNLNHDGGLAGNNNRYYTRDHRIAVIRPACTKGTCSAYASDWSAVGQITAPGDVNGDGHPDLVTVENDHLWLFLGSSRTGAFSEAHEIGTAAWNGYTITSPGDTDKDGHPDLWARNKTTGVIYDYPLGTDSLGTRTAITNGAFTTTDRPLLASPGDADGDGIADLYTVTDDKELWANMGTAPDANGYRLGAHHVASAAALWKTITDIA